MSIELENENIPQRRGKKTKKDRKHRKGKGKKSKFRTVLKILLLVILVAILAFGCYTAVIIAQTPKIDPNDLYSNLSQASKIYDQKGKEIRSVYVGDNSNRTNVDYDQIPEDMVNAVVAIEDKTFWEHHGFNVVRIMGAIKDTVFGGGRISGTSTITQQLARNIYLTNERSFKRKIREAYYTICLEKSLTKEQIVEAYLNTVNLGYGAYGIQSAAQAYFNKDVEDLKLLDCAALAAVIQSPSSSALVLRYEKGSTVPDKDKIIKTDNEWIYYYNGDASENRRNTTLQFMCDQGYISQERLEKAKQADLRKRLKLRNSSGASFASYFTDYVISEVIDDFVEQEGMSKEDASRLVYNGGLEITSTLDSTAQEAVEEVYSEGSNFPGTRNLRMDGEGNILNSNGAVMLRRYSNYFDDDGDFTFKSDEYTEKDDGSLLLKKGKRLNFYKTSSSQGEDINIEFKNLYTIENGRFYSIEGGVINIEPQYKSLDDDGNVIIASDFFTDNPDFFKKNNGSITISEKEYTLRQKINQPQSAMVIIDNETGQIKAMIGGRGTSGNMLYNRATGPQQPGSAIKPLAVYSSALQQGADAAANNSPQSFSYMYDKSNKSSYGKWWTANSLIDDSKMTVNGKVWPKNWYNGYKGYQTLRYSVEQSINVNAVKVLSEVGTDYAVSQLKKFGVTSVKTDGTTNDLNPAALALGGMTHGISTLEMASAYAALANLGTYNNPTAYTSVKDRNGDTILKPKHEETQVIDKGVAWIMDDILHTTVTRGIASAASISSQPVAGKTGTTSDDFDVWMCGFTPQYAAAVWIGNDVNIELNSGSTIAASLWAKVMSKVCAQFDRESFPKPPSNVVYRNGEYFIDGTVQSIKKPMKEVEVEVCADSGEKPTPSCPHVVKKKFKIKGDAEEKDAGPEYYCHLHNKNPGKYAMDPKYVAEMKRQEEEKKRQEEEKKKQEQEQQQTTTPDPAVKPEDQTTPQTDTTPQL